MPAARPSRLHLAFTDVENAYRENAQALHRKALELAELAEVYRRLKKRRDVLRERLRKQLQKDER